MEIVPDPLTVRDEEDGERDVEWEVDMGKVCGPEVDGVWERRVIPMDLALNRATVEDLEEEGGEREEVCGKCHHTGE